LLELSAEKEKQKYDNVKGIAADGGKGKDNSRTGGGG